ncbi:MFS transporter [Burkholderia dolosa]|uniref:MFS transporter n=1 Tax=Burkholderia dolosa TaxID=152500 RepID=UPI001B92F52B|nr:MFS transporter [Burkholderia dolosa]MBR8302437.1 MFS transporter [Burkholderia dolosa]
MSELADSCSAAARTRRWWLLAGVCIASFLGCIDFTIVNTAIPDIQADLHASVTQSQWIVTAFLIALCASMVAAGRMADLYGRRPVLYIGLTVFGLSSLGAGLATAIAGVIACRFVQGIACAVLYTATTAIASAAFGEDERGKALGILFGANGIGLAIGPVVGGVLVGALGWRSVFLVNVPFVLASVALCIYGASELPDVKERGRIDWCGLLLLAVAVPLLLLGITQGNRWGWTSFRTSASFAVAVALFAALVRVERTVRSPLIRFELFSNRDFVRASIATSSLAFFYCAAFFLMPLYLKIVAGFSDVMIGVMLLPTTALIALLSPFVGRATDRIGPVRFLAAGFLFFAVSAAMQAQFARSVSIGYVVAAFAVMGIGWACVLGPSTVLALASVPEDVGGVAVGTSWTMHNLGGATGLSVATTVYQVFAGHGLSAALAARVAIDADRTASIVADPLSADARLSRLGIDHDAARDLVTQYFLHGYRACMWLLVAVSLFAFCAVTVKTVGRIRSAQQ